MKRKDSKSYTAKDIVVLKGVEPVRKRPGMYIGSTGKEGLHRLVFETIANAVDEAIMGFCDKIVVRLLKDDLIEVEDNGRGIPVEIHPKTKKSALETVMTTLHAGAKFGGKVYASTGGLHGVGISAVCALSKYLRAEVCRDGFLYFQEYRRGRPISAVKKLKKCKNSGTKIIFSPDPIIFKKVEFDPLKILNYLREQAFLSKKVKFCFLDKRTKEKESKYCFYFEGGIRSYLSYLLGENKPRHQNFFYVKGKKEGIELEASLIYSNEIESEEKGFVNHIHTPEKGTHITGFRTALTRAINDWAKRENYLKEIGENLTGEDTREGLIAIVSVRLKEPQFEGQTKQRLGNPEAKTAVEGIIYPAFLEYLERYPQDAKEIVKGAILAHKARKAAKAAKLAVLKKGLIKGLSLPGKLTDCLSNKPEERELYIVEGESAGGTAKQARDRKFQAILPIKGKILNVEKARIDKILSSKEIKSLILALGTSIASEFDLEKLKYHKIIIMTDADVDGAHIRALLLTLFFRYFRKIIEKGYLYIAQPPLYKIESKKKTFYTYSEEEKNKLLKKIKEKVIVSRFKGLGEMDSIELWETTMDPQKRILKKVTIEDGEKADRVFDILMGGEVEPRKRFIINYAREVKNLDI